MEFLKRVLGICETPKPSDDGAWTLNGRTVTVQRDRIRELSEKGGAVRLEGKGLASRLLVVQAADGQFHAYENRCTHMGRRIDAVEGENKLRCCSVSRTTYDMDGHSISGPGTKPLKRYTVTAEGDRLVIDLSRPLA